MDYAGEAGLSEMPRLAEALWGLGCGPEVAVQSDQPAARQGDPQAVALPTGLEESASEGTARYSLRFERDLQNRSTVTGTVRAQLRLQCQRCLDEVEIPVDLRIALALIRKDEDALELPDDLDPLLVTDDGIRPLDIVEDELLLAIPAFPTHAWACGEFGWSEPGLRTEAASDVVDEAPDATRRPFAVLAALKPRDGH